MKTARLFISYITILLMLSILTVSGVMAQGTDSRNFSRKKPAGKMYAGINLVPKMAAISYKGISPDSLKIKSGSSFDFAVEAGYFFSEYAGISAGAGLSSFSARLSMDSYGKSYLTKDSDQESFQMQISGRNITENQKIGLLSIPVCLILRYPAGDKLKLFLNTGISFSIPIVKSYTGAGTFTYKAYYPAYPVTIEDYPAYYPKDYLTNTTGTLEVKSVIPGIVASAGASFSISESLQLGIGLYFNKSLGSISGYTDSPENFRLTSAKDDLQTIMGTSSSSGVRSVGLSIGLKYYIK